MAQGACRFLEMDGGEPLSDLSSLRSARPPLSGAHNRAWQDLLHQVMEANPDIQDVLDVAALVESCGYSDVVVEETFGYASIFDLAEDLYQDIRRQVRTAPLPPNTDIPLIRLILRMARDFTHGLTFALPMAVSVVAMIVLRISYSSYQYFTVAQATALALATFLSFVTTGGFTQAMAFSYYLLIGIQESTLVEATLLRLMTWGLLLSGLMAVGLIAVDGVVSLMPLSLVSFTALYLVILAALWLAFANLYVLRREYVLTAITAVAVLMAYGLWKHGFPVVYAQIASMIFAALASVISALIIFRRHSKKLKEGIRVVRTRPSQMAYQSWPYFAYGLLYFLFMYADRLVSWTTNSSYMPYYIWFRGQYELGMDWSLGTLILPLAAAEVLISYLLQWLQTAEHRVPSADVAVLARGMRGMYLRALLIFAAMAMVSFLFAHSLAVVAAKTPLLRTAAPSSGVEPFVFAWSSAAYVVMAVALFNILFLFTLSYPSAALRVLSIGLGIDLAVGLVATRVTLSYQNAVFGLLAASIYVMLTSSLSVLRLIPKIDFLLYRAT